MCAASSQAHTPEASASRGLGCCCRSLRVPPGPARDPPVQLPSATSPRGDSRGHTQPGEVGQAPRAPSGALGPPRPVVDHASPRHNVSPRSLPPLATGLKTATPDQTTPGQTGRGTSDGTDAHAAARAFR